MKITKTNSTTIQIFKDKDDLADSISLSWSSDDSHAYLCISNSDESISTSLELEEIRELQSALNLLEEDKIARLNRLRT